MATTVRIICLIVVLLSIYSLYNNNNNLNKDFVLSTTTNNSKQQQQQHISKIDAVVTIAIGSYSPIRLLTGLRRIGNFHGPIYILSDNINDFNNWKKLGIHSIYPISFDDIAATTSSTSSSTKKFDRSTTSITWYKTQLREIINSANNANSNDDDDDDSKSNKTTTTTRKPPRTPLPSKKNNINTVLFMDSDIQVKGSLKSLEDFLFVRSQQQQQKQKQYCNAYFFNERWYVEDQFNSGLGIFFLQQNSSTALLENWSNAILSGLYPNDQTSLDIANTNTQLQLLQQQQQQQRSSNTISKTNNNNYKICSLSKFDNYFTTDFVSFILNKVTFGWRIRHSIFLHPTGGKNLTAMSLPDDGTDLEKPHFYKKKKKKVNPIRKLIGY